MHEEVFIKAHPSDNQNNRAPIRVDLGRRHLTEDDVNQLSALISDTVNTGQELEWGCAPPEKSGLISLGNGKFGELGVDWEDVVFQARLSLGRGLLGGNNPLG